jgi:choline dehydrogenase-like flavoprotein
MRGFALHPYTVDADGVRSDAAAAYYQDISGRSNLHVWVNASIARILWRDTTRKDVKPLVATGVEVLHHGGRASGPQWVHARREVILAAGAMRSSGILELSGVGNPRYALSGPLNP